MENLAYIQQLASNTGTDISKWDMSRFEPVSQDRRAINKLFFSISAEKPAENTASVSEEVVQQVKKAVALYGEQRHKALITSTQYSLDSFIRDARELNRRAQEMLENARGERNKLDYLQKIGPSLFWEEIEKVLHDPFWSYKAVIGNVLYFTTRNPIVLVESNPKAGLKREVPMGKYTAALNLQSGSIRVGAEQDNPKVSGGYYHPYIGNDGTVCWGNASETANQFLVKSEYGQLFKLLATLLSNYHPETTPYVRLHDFAIALGLEKPNQPAPATGRAWCEECDEQRDGCNCGEWCSICDRSHDDCECHFCDTCEERSRERCAEHWCSICRTYDFPDCGCCHDCGNTRDYCDYCSECDSHECICCHECGGTTEEHGENCALHPSQQTEEIPF
jgi:hypothetical protein